MFLSMRPARSSSSSISDDDDARETRPKAPASARAAAPLHVEDVGSASSTYVTPRPSSDTTHFSQSVVAAQSPRGEAPALARRQRVVARDPARQLRVAKDRVAHERIVVAVDRLRPRAEERLVRFATALLGDR